MKKIITFALLLMLLVTTSVVGLAATRASDQLSCYSISVTSVGGGVVRVTSTVNATHMNMTKLGFPTISLYELQDGTWINVKVVTSQYTSGAGSYGYQYEYKGVIGKTYYAYSSFLGEDSLGSTTRTANSGTCVPT